MAQRSTARRNFSFGSTQYSAALGRTYSSERERKKLLADRKRQDKKDRMDEQRERVEAKKLRASELAADAKIAAAERKISAAGKKIETADKKVEKGALTEAGFAAIKARMEREIEAQEQHKADVLAKNPTCATTRKERVSDRAKRYRANQPGCKPAGTKQCKICRSKRFLTVDHIDGDESNGRKSNLRWLCKSCNTRLGAEMARSGVGRRTEQYNPKGATSFEQWSEAVATLHGEGLGEMTVDQAREIVRETSKRKRSEFNSDVWRIRKERYGPSGRKSGGASSDVPDWVTNPASSAAQYRLAQAVLSGTAHEAMPRRIAQEIVDRTPARDRSIFMMGSAGENPMSHGPRQGGMNATEKRHDAEVRKLIAKRFAEGEDAEKVAKRVWRSYGYLTDVRDGALIVQLNAGRERFEPAALSNPSARTAERNQPIGDDSEEYRQASRTAELFHGRPVKEEIEVTESIRTHDWYVSYGPLVKLIIKPITKKPKKRVPLPFHQSEAGTVQLFCSPDGRQFYLRGGDQELDLKAFGMGEGSRWFRDHMVIGEAVEITYRDRKKFHSFKLTDYFHKLGEETGEKPTLAYDSLSKKLSIIGGAYRVEMDDLVDGMSPGIVN